MLKSFVSYFNETITFFWDRNADQISVERMSESMTQCRLSIVRRMDMHEMGQCRKIISCDRAEKFGQNYVRSAATSVEKSENSPQFSYIILR